MKRLILLSAIMTIVTTVASTHGAVILETSGPGSTNGGSAIYSGQFLSARFLITERTLITKIGGHVKGQSETDRSIFAAVISLMDTDPFDDAIPEADALGSPLFATTFIAPFNNNPPYPYQVPTTLIETSFVLEPGGYGLVFGSGLFGATGTAWMPVRGSTVDLPWFFQGNSSGDWIDRDRDQPMRFLVEGELAPVPEPSTLAIWSLLGVLGLAIGWKRKRRS